MPFLLRYDLDSSRPRAGAAFKDLLVRAIAPGIVLFLAIYGFGLALMGPLKGWGTAEEWWYAVIPGIAIALQASIFVAATELTGRPRPEVSKLDPAPPTSSYPSGHVGAATALYLSLAFMAHRIDNVVLRRLVQFVCVLIPFLVAYARAYRGMHHVIDIVVGMLNGVLCALMAWLWLRRKEARSS